MASKDGKRFQEDIKNSCDKQNIFYDKIHDQFIPPEYRGKIPVTKNKYDCYIFKTPVLIPTELKSTQDNKFSFSESIIKQHQIDWLYWATQYEGTIPGFIFNFRSFNNETYFVHILDFMEYKRIAENKIKSHKYIKINKSSIPIEVCRQIGLEIKNKLMKKRYFYDIKDFIENAIKRFHEGWSNEKRRTS